MIAASSERPSVHVFRDVRGASQLRARRGAKSAAALFVVLLTAACAGAETAPTVEFCLLGEFDLGTRYQGLDPEPGDVSAASWCVVTEETAERVHFSATGLSNPDMDGAFAVSYFAPDRVRLINREIPPDLELVGASIMDETLRYRRIDPLILVAELQQHPDWIVTTSEDGQQVVRYPGAGASTAVRIVDGRLLHLSTEADLPLRGRVPVEWIWQWTADDAATLSILLDSTPLFTAEARWTTLTEAEAAAVWEPSGGEPPDSAPGDGWPAEIAMEVESVAEGVHLVRGVRTGFHHLVVETEDGLVVGDAPAGWVELPQIPPTDLVPGLGVSGLSEGFVDFLRERIPGSIHAVALTHAHDDHAGGARAFVAAGADIYAPAGVAGFLEDALNASAIPPDRLAGTGQEVDVLPVRDRVTLGGGAVELIDLGPNPHVSHALGVWAREAGYFFQSDLHVPVSTADEPRAERAGTECWFARWAVDNLPEHTTILSSHRAVRTPVARLARYLESPLCG